MGSFSASTHTSFLLSRLRLPSRSTYTHVRSRTAVILTVIRPTDRFWGAGAAPARVPAGFFEPSLEELTPELPDPTHRDGNALDHDRLPSASVGDDLLLALRNSLGMNPDHPFVHTAFLDDQRTNLGVALQPPSACDLETAHSDHVAADEAGDRDLDRANIRFHVSFRTDQQVPIALDLAAEVAQQLAATLQLQPARERVVAAEHGRLWL